MAKTKLVMLLQDDAKRTRLLSKLQDPIVIKRFNALTTDPDKNGCRFHIGDLVEGKTKRYVNFFIDKEFGMLGFHVVAFLMNGGELTLEKCYVLHSCHNPGCRAYQHLRAGNDKDNHEDMIKAGHALTGDKNPARKYVRPLTKIQLSDKKQIHELRAAGWRYKEIAARFSIHPTRVAQILHISMAEHRRLAKQKTLAPKKEKKKRNEDMTSRSGNNHWTKRLPELKLEVSKQAGKFLPRQAVSQPKR